MRAAKELELIKGTYHQGKLPMPLLQLSSQLGRDMQAQARVLRLEEDMQKFRRSLGLGPSESAEQTAHMLSLEAKQAVIDSQNGMLVTY